MTRSGAPYLNQDISVFDWLAAEQSSSIVSPTFAERTWTGNEDIGTTGLQEKEEKNLLTKSFSYFQLVGMGYLPVCKHKAFFCYIVSVREKKDNNSFEGNKNGDRVWSQISNFQFLFSIFNSLILRLSFQEDHLILMSQKCPRIPGKREIITDNNK